MTNKNALQEENARLRAEINELMKRIYQLENVTVDTVCRKCGDKVIIRIPAGDIKIWVTE